MYQLQCRAINRSNTILLENVRTIETQESGCKHDPSSITHTSVCFLWWWGYHSITNSYCRLHYMRVWCAQSFGTNPILLVSERCFLILILVLIIITVLTLVALVATPQTVCSPLSATISEWVCQCPMKGAGRIHLEIKLCLIQKIVSSTNWDSS